MELLTLALLLLPVINAQAPNTNSVCGGSSGLSCFNSAYGPCCSAQGTCGSTAGLCSTSAGCQPRYGSCSAPSLVNPSPGTFRPPSSNGKCGPRNGGTACINSCCRRFGSAFGASGGTCGRGDAYCGAGNCETAGYGFCYGTPPTNPSPGPPAPFGPFCVQDQSKRFATYFTIAPQGSSLRVNDATSFAAANHRAIAMFTIQGNDQNLILMANNNIQYPIKINNDDDIPTYRQKIGPYTAATSQPKLINCRVSGTNVLTCQAVYKTGLRLYRFVTEDATDQTICLQDGTTTDTAVDLTLTIATGAACAFP